MRLPTMLLLTGLVTTSLACDDGGSDNSDGGTADAQTTADMANADMSNDGALLDAAADAGIVDAGPRPLVKHAGWCTRVDSESGTLTRTTTRTYDMRDRLVTEVSARVGAEDEAATTTWAWDDGDRLLRKTRVIAGQDRVYPDETYAYTGDGLLREVTHVDPAGVVLRWTLDSANGNYTARRTYVDDAQEPTYETLDWDDEANQLRALNTHRTSDDAIIGFSQFTYKARNPGQGKIESEARDQDFEDGEIDVRTRYGYESTMGILERMTTQLYDRLGGEAGEPEETVWDNLIMSGLHTVRSISVGGEVRATYAHIGDTVEVTAGCDVTVYQGSIAEVQRPGGITRFSSKFGGDPRVSSASATFEPSGPLLRRVDCDGNVIAESTYDAAGNVNTEVDDIYQSEYTYDCW